MRLPILQALLNDLARQSQEARHFILRDFKLDANLPSDNKRRASRAGTEAVRDVNTPMLTSLRFGSSDVRLASK
jgi:hypothetical protein